MASAFSVSTQNKTGLVPNSLVGNNNSKFISMTPDFGINFYDSVSTVLATISWNGISTNNPNGFDIQSPLNMNNNNINNVNSLNGPTGGIDLTLNSSGNIQLDSSGNIILDSSGNIILDSSGNIDLYSANTVGINAQNSSMSLSANDDITIQSAGLGSILINAPNMNSYGNALPICLNQFENGIWSYTLGGQQFEDVFARNPITIALPTQFFADTPQSGYTSTRWQINFDMNCWNFANAGDKGFAIYLSFLDSNSNLYEPFLYNSQTPYCKWDNPPSFNNPNPPNYSQFKSINFCDYIDFGVLAGSFNSNIQLQMNIAGDSPFNNVDFKFKLGFTRIQRV